MSAAGPSQGARPLLQEGVREVREANEPGGGFEPSAAGPSQGARPLLQEGVREAAPAASLGEVAS